MKVEKQNTINENGTYTAKKKITTTEEDGWIDTRETHGRRAVPGERYFKGKAVSYHIRQMTRKLQNRLLLYSVL